MRSKRVLVCMSIVTVLLLLTSSMAAMPGAAASERAERVIVLFKDKIDEKVVKDEGGKIDSTLSVMPAVITSLTDSAIKSLQKSDKVKLVVKDESSYVLLGKPDNPGKPDKPGKGGGGGKKAEELPWGVDKIDAEKVWSTTTGGSIKVAVIDSGIDEDHPDLTVSDGVSFVSYTSSYEDDNGHGTHCAGIIGAKHNDVGIKGIAPDVELYAVKVIDSGGWGSYLDAIKGINWAAENGMNVISMSLGWEDLDEGAEELFETACVNAVASGVVMVVAAGNSGTRDDTEDNILVPAAFESVITVGAVASSGKRAQWSATGPALDIVAPGVRIKSTYYNGKYTQMSGTSMAAPHVAGTVALILTVTSGYVGKGLVDQVKAVLEGSADDLGDADTVNAFGWGLVDAEEAVIGFES
jgi:minor extracellular protease Epr